LENKRLNWKPVQGCEQCDGFAKERERERISALGRANNNHFHTRCRAINKRKTPHLALFHADIEALERELEQFYQRHQQYLYRGWELKSIFNRPIGPLPRGMQRFYARANPNRLIDGFALF
jgi:hypothetical protein